MNPLKWSVWVRIAIVVTIVWMVGGFAVWYGKSDRLSTDDILCFLFPVVLFWGIAWIVLGISNEKIRVRVIKILIGIVAVFALVGIFLIIQDSFFTPPTSLAPQSSEAPRDLLSPPYQNLPKPGGDSRR